MNDTYSTIDIYTGLGSMSYAARSAGFEVVKALDHNEKYRNIYERNFGTGIFSTMESEYPDFEKVPDTPLIIGRLPISVFQPPDKTFYSQTHWDLLKNLIQAKRPHYLFFILSRKFHAAELERLSLIMRAENYSVSCTSIDTCEAIGLPVHEQKTYLVGTHKTTGGTFQFPYMIPPTVISLSDLLERNTQYTAADIIDPSTIEWPACGRPEIFNWKREKYQPDTKISYNYMRPSLVVTDIGIRKISNRELARSKGFPDSFELPDTGKSVTYRRICDSANVLIAARILKTLHSMLGTTAVVSDSLPLKKQNTPIKIFKKPAGLQETVPLNQPAKDPEEIPSKPHQTGEQTTKPAEKHSENSATVSSDKRRIFLSYCQKDSEIADLIEDKLSPLINSDFTISRDNRDVGYLNSFKRFMESIRQHDYVIMLISDRYIKSFNCMFEVTEVLKDSDFGKRILFIVLTDSDKKYLNANIKDCITADIYTPQGQGSYILYWKKRKEEMHRLIEELGYEYALEQIKNIRQIEKITLGLADFYAHVSDAKGLPMQQHLDSNFKDILNILYPSPGQ